MHIDLNCDLGEGAGSDADVMPLITTANVACGFHAGDPTTAFETIRQAKANNVRVGAHPSFPDREHFGRREIVRSQKEVYEDCIYQIGALVTIARVLGTTLSHVKPHGALYNMACRDSSYAYAIVMAADAFHLPLVGLPESRMEALSATTRFVAEGFADRGYRPDGSLVPRSEAGAFIESPEMAVRQAIWLVRERGVRTLCVHGDNPQALAFVRALRDGLTAAGFDIRPFA